MTSAGKAKLRVFILVLIALAAFGLAVRVWFLERKVDNWRLLIRGEARPASYKERCEALGGAHARLHDATANVLYDEVCIFGKLPGDDAGALPGDAR